MARRKVDGTRPRARRVGVAGALAAAGALSFTTVGPVAAGAAPPTVPPAAPPAAPPTTQAAPEPTIVTVPVTTQQPAPPSPTTTVAATTTTRPPVVESPSPTTTRPTTPRVTTPRPTPTTTATRDQGTMTSLDLPSTSERPPQTSCQSVVQIGDSLSVGLDSPGYIKDPDARISARYAAIGVRTLRLESSGGRSVVEHLERQDGGEVVARKVRKSGFHGCWVIALGTNDAANIDAGSDYGYSERIDRMMAVIGDDPVLWVDAKTLRKAGHYASEHMRMFNAALAKAHARYPALQVYAWSDAVADDWFQPDGIHYTTGGAAYRAALIPAALAAAFPAD
jgi:hypothetical protein